MKKSRLLVFKSIFILNMNLMIIAANLEYNFKIDKDKNKLVIADHTPKRKIKNEADKARKPKTHKNSKGRNNSGPSGKRLSKMVELGHLIDRITDRMEKDKKMEIDAKAAQDQNEKSKNLTLKQSPSDPNAPPDRKNFDMGSGLAVAGGAAALAGGAAVMGSMADNENMQNEIDRLKMERCVLYIADRLAYDMNTELLESARGFATLKTRAETIAKGFEERSEYLFDHVDNIMQEIAALTESSHQAMGHPERIPDI